MVNRMLTGPLAVALGATGLLVGWQIDRGGGDSGLLAALSALVMATGVLLAYGFSLAGLSGALGVLALACLGLASAPYLGSWETSVLHALATALGAVALTAGTAAAGTAWNRAADWRMTTAVVGLVGAAITLYAGYDSYDVYATTAHHAVLVIATIGGATASLALGMAIAWPSIAGCHGGAAGDDGGQAAPAPSVAPAPPFEPPVPSPGPAAPVVQAPPATRTAEPETAVGARPLDRLQTLSAVVGLVIGLITLAKELVAAILALAQ